MNISKSEEFIEIKKKIDLTNNLDELENLRINVLGKKGILAKKFAEMKTIPANERKEFAKDLNLFISAALNLLFFIGDILFSENFLINISICFLIFQAWLKNLK